MKKEPLMCIMAFTCLFLSCSNLEMADSVSELEKNYLSVENAIYVDKEFPYTTTDVVLEGYEISSQVMDKVYVSISSKNQVSRFYIGIENISGFWEYVPTEERIGGNEEYKVYDIPVIMKPMYSGSSTIKISGVIGNGTVTAPAKALAIGQTTEVPEEGETFYMESMPTAITGDAYNITSTSVTLSASYEDVPEEAICYLYLCQENNTSDNNIRIVLYPGINLTYDWKQLKGGLTYNYWAVIDCNGVETKGEVKSFTTPIPVSIVKFEQTKASYWPDHYQNDGKDYSFMFNAKTYIKITDDTNVKDWGYVYIDPDGVVSKKLSMMKYGRKSIIDPNVAYYRNEYEDSVTLQAYVEYEGDSQTYYGEKQRFPIAYPKDISVEMQSCQYLGYETDVMYNNVGYKHKSSFGYVYDVVGAYWLAVGTKEVGSGWANWQNDLPNGVVQPHDGQNSVKINYHYNDKSFGGNYNVYLRGRDETHNQECLSGNYASYTYTDNHFSGCSFHSSNSTVHEVKGEFGEDNEKFYEIEIDKCY